MKKSLLAIVQDVLNAMTSDRVNDIDDTFESQQVAQIAQNVYFAMMANRNWPHTKRLIQLESSTDVNKPNYLRLPDNVKELVSFHYQTQKITDTDIKLSEIKFLENDQFIKHISGRNTDNPNVRVITDFNGGKLFIYDNLPPTYWTTFDDTYIITDSYDAGIDSTLQNSKSQCVAYVVPNWTYANDFIPDLPVDAFPAFIEEVKSTSFAQSKQVIDQKSEQNAARQNRWLSRKAWRAEGGVRYPNYGRKGKR